MRVFHILLVIFALWINKLPASKVGPVVEIQHEDELSREQLERLVNLAGKTNLSTEELKPLILQGQATDFEILAADYVKGALKQKKIHRQLDNQSFSEWLKIVRNTQPKKDVSNYKEWGDSFIKAIEFGLSIDREKEKRLYYPVQGILSRISSYGFDEFDDARFFKTEYSTRLLVQKIVDEDTVEPSIPEYLIMAILDLPELSHVQAFELAKFYDLQRKEDTNPNSYDLANDFEIVRRDPSKAFHRSRS